MKRNISIIICLIFITLFSACTKKQPEINEQMYHSQGSVIECNDGWFLFVEHTYNIADKTITDKSFNLDAVNLKYNNLNDFQILCYDSETQKVIDRIRPEVSYLSMNPEYKLMLNQNIDVFKNRKMSSDLTNAELPNINSEMFTKDDIVNVYNKAIERGDLNFGKYGNISESGLKRDNELNGYMWQVGYFVIYGNIEAVNIELVNADGSYLSDINLKNLSTEQKELIEIINNLEKNILEKQSFIDLSIEDCYDNYSVDINRLFMLLNKIEEENKL